MCVESHLLFNVMQAAICKVGPYTGTFSAILEQFCADILHDAVTQVLVGMRCKSTGDGLLPSSFFPCSIDLTCTQLLMDSQLSLPHEISN